MAFFSDGSAGYFSLSLRPAGDAKVHVFRLTRTQVSAISVTLPLCLILSASALLLVIALGLFEHSGALRAWLGKGQQTALVSVLAFAACFTAITELCFFLWVRATKSSRLDDTERRSLRHLRLSRNISLTAYAAFLFAIFVPIAGLFALPGGLEGTEADLSGTGTSGFLFMVQLAIAAMFLMLALVLRLFRIVASGAVASDRSEASSLW